MQTQTSSRQKIPFMLAFSVGAVLFSAHAGGGFATGNQANTYYVGLGWLGPICAVTAIAIYAIGIFKGENLYDILRADFAEVGFGNLPKAILNALTYAGFQCVSYYTSMEGGTAIPTLTSCREMGMGWLTVIYGICLLLCLISTGVTTTYGFVARFEKLPVFRSIQSAPVRSAIMSAFIIVLSMTISLAGLTNIIKYGYGYCGFLAIAVVAVPFLTVGVYKNRKYIKAHPECRG